MVLSDRYGNVLLVSASGNAGNGTRSQEIGTETGRTGTEIAGNGTGQAETRPAAGEINETRDAKAQARINRHKGQRTPD